MKIGSTTVRAFYGDIVKAGADAIMNPANDMLWTGGGVSAQIHKAGGPEIESEALAKAPVAIGDAVVTGAGKLDARFIVHAVIAGQDLATDERSIRSAVKSGLAAADNAKAASLAIPLLDSVSFDVEIHVVAQLIVDEVVNYLLASKSGLKDLFLVEQEETVRGVFDTALTEKFTRH